MAPRVDRLLARAVDEQVSEQRLIRDALDDTAERLARLEGVTAALEEKIRPWSDPGAATADLAMRVEERIAKRLHELEQRLDDMADTIEERAVDTVADDFSYIADELRKAVGDLARLLVRDRSRVSNILTEHRNAIIAEIRMPGDETEIRLPRDDWERTG